MKPEDVLDQFVYYSVQHGNSDESSTVVNVSDALIAIQEYADLQCARLREEIKGLEAQLEDKELHFALWYSKMEQKKAQQQEEQEQILESLLTEYRNMRNLKATNYSIILYLLDQFTITRKP